jgi:hypothetical protein
MARLASPDHEPERAGSAHGGCILDPRAGTCARHARRQEQTMLDILMLTLAAGFFALAIGYTYACERL